MPKMLAYHPLSEQLSYLTEITSRFIRYSGRSGKETRIVLLVKILLIGFTAN